MERLRLGEVGIGAAARSAAAVLHAGGVILYPTDTLYGLGADALSDVAVARVYAIKKRDARKPIHCIVSDTAMAERYAEFTPVAHTLTKEFWPGPLTLILKKKSGIDSGISRGIATIGVRIPGHEFCIALAREFGKPYTTTSANISGEESPRSPDAILRKLGEAQIDLTVDAGELPGRQPSTVVDLSSETPIVLREGAIPTSDIFDVLGEFPRGKKNL